MESASFPYRDVPHPDAVYDNLSINLLASNSIVEIVDFESSCGVVASHTVPLS